MYASSSMPASAYFLRSFERDEETSSPAISLPFAQKHPAAPQLAPAPIRADDHVQPENHTPRTPVRRPSTNGTSDSARPHFSRPASNGRDPKPANATRPSQSGSNGRPVRRTSDARPGSTRTQSGTRSAAGTRWSASKNGKHKGAHRFFAHQQRNTVEWILFARFNEWIFFARFKWQRRAPQWQTGWPIVEQAPYRRQDSQSGRKDGIGTQRRATGTQEPSHADRYRAARGERQAVL